MSYQVVVQTQQYRVASLDELQRTPVAIAGQPSPQLLSNLAEFQRTTTPLSLNHYNVQPVFGVYASVQDTDLGFVSAASIRSSRNTKGRSPKPARSSSAGRCRA